MPSVCAVIGVGGILKTISTMKKQPIVRTFVGAVLFALLSQSSLLAQDAHVSLWNFDSGDLSATAGSDMEYMEDTGDLVTFGTTEALGIPAVGGEVANVIQIPKLAAGQGLSGAPAGGLQR